MLSKQSVTIGAGIGVTVRGAVWGVWAADNKNVPVGQAVRGALVAKTATAVDVRAENEQEVRRYVLVPPGYTAGPKVQEVLQVLATGSEVNITWRLSSNARIVTGLTVLGPPACMPRTRAALTMSR